MKKKAYVSKNAPDPLSYYSQVVQAGDFLFLAGQIPLTAQGTMVEGDISVQARQVLDNLREVLRAAGSEMNDVVKTTVFLADIADFEAANKVYMQYFQEPYPARSTVQVAKLPKGARIEIDAIAWIVNRKQ